MIAVVVVTKSDLNAEIADSLRIELGARLRRLVHRHGRKRVAVVTLLFERSRAHNGQRRAPQENFWRWKSALARRWLQWKDPGPAANESHPIHGAATRLLAFRERILTRIGKINHTSLTQGLLLVAAWGPVTHTFIHLVPIKDQSSRLFNALF